MLSFEFSPEQEIFRETLREFSLKELLPRYAEGDAGNYPRDRIIRVIELIGEVDDDSASFVSAGIVAEEVGRGDFNCVLPSLGPFLFREFISQASPELKARWLPGLESGRQMIGLGLTEPDAGSDMGAIRTRADRQGDDYLLNGEKNSVSFLNADVFYIFARTDPETMDWSGLSAFLIPRDAPGLSFHAYDDMGCRAVPRGQLFLDDVRVPASDMVGASGRAFPMIREFFDLNRAFIALKCLGAAQQTVDETIEHVKGREQFGEALSSFQGVAFPLAEASTLIEAARWLAYKVLWLRDQGQRCDTEGAMVKWWVPKICVEIIHECLLLHGHYGYTKELPIEQRLRDVIGWQIGDGPAQIQKLILARRLFGRESAP
ncbi:MAG: cyclohexanecarboxyl-CoA dehydrogenase [bacterium]|nr:cyclohexanecarboxyl-CoA dehydrogenase [bacterium]